MKNQLLTVAALLLTATAALAQTPATKTSTGTTNWNFDPSHTQVRFNVSHLVISETEGVFRKASGTVSTTGSDFTDARISFTIDVNSIDTDNEGRDKHLKGDDFFNAEKYPQITFVSTSLKKVSGNNYKLTGNLTIRDVTKPVVLDVVYGGTTKDPWGNTRAGFKVKGTVNRFDYNLKWNTMTEAGGAVVGENVDLVANVELIAAK